MSAIELNRRMVLESPVQVADGAGGFALTWVPQGVLWAEVAPGTGTDAAGIDVLLAKTSYRITVRGAPVGSPARPSPAQRLRDGSRVFKILAVTERDASGLYLICFAREEMPK